MNLWATFSKNIYCNELVGSSFCVCVCVCVCVCAMHVGSARSKEVALGPILIPAFPVNFVDLNDQDRPGRLEGFQGQS